MSDRKNASDSCDGSCSATIVYDKSVTLTCPTIQFKNACAALLWVGTHRAVHHVLCIYHKLRAEQLLEYLALSFNMHRFCDLPRELSLSLSCRDRPEEYVPREIISKSFFLYFCSRDIAISQAERYFFLENNNNTNFISCVYFTVGKCELSNLITK